MSQRQHVAVDIAGADPVHLDNPAWLEQRARAAALDGGATVLDVLKHHFEPQGVTLVLLLAESHLSVHTWPELGECYIDVFTCGEVDPRPIAQALAAAIGGEGRYVLLGTAKFVRSGAEGYTQER